MSPSQCIPLALSPSTLPLILSLSKESGRLRTGLSKGERRKEGRQTVPFDLLFMFFAGVAFAVAAAAERGFRSGPVFTALAYTLFAALPVAIGCYVLAPAWCWMYWVNPADVPAWAAIPVFAAYPVVMLIGFFLAARIRGARSRLRLVGVPLLGIAALTLTFPRRLFTVGTMEDWAAGATVPLWSAGWVGVVAIGGGLAAFVVFVIVARRLTQIPSHPPLKKGGTGGFQPIPVSIVRCGNDIESALRESLSAWNGLQHLTQRLPRKGNTILLKPNIGGGSTFRPGTCTSVEFLLAAIRIIREAVPAARMAIVESNMIFWRMDRYMPRTPYAAALRNAGVEFLNLSEEPRVPLDLGGWLGVQDVPKVLADGAVLIDLPVPKTHAFFRMSGAIKNLFGLLPKQNKIVHYHMLRGGDWDGEIFLDLFRSFPPDLVMVDGVVSGEGHCPLGSAKPTGFVLTTPDAFATDLTLCNIMGMDPRRVPYLRRLVDSQFTPTLTLPRRPTPPKQLRLRRLEGGGAPERTSSPLAGEDAGGGYGLAFPKLAPEDFASDTPWRPTNRLIGLPANAARLLRDHARLYRG